MRAGQVISEKDKCPQCQGNKVVQDKKILEVVVERGMQHNQKIEFRGEADEAVRLGYGARVTFCNALTGLPYLRHSRTPSPGISSSWFSRRSTLCSSARVRAGLRCAGLGWSLTLSLLPGSDLFYEKTLTLSEALCGFKFAIPHLDGRQLLISSNEGDIVKPGSFKAVYDEGMPVWQRGSEKGRLFIHFNVVFPEPGDLGDKEVAQLAALLPPRPGLEVDLDACHEVSVSDIDMEQEMKRQRERQLEEDEEDDPRGGRVQCAQQ